MDVTRIILMSGCAVVSVGMFAFAVYLYVSSESFRDQAELVEGRVTKIETISDPDGSGPLYCPVVRYTTVKGETLTNTSSVCSAPASYKEGDTVQIYYDPKNPKVFEIKDLMSKRLAVIVTGGLGVMFGGFAILIFLTRGWVPLE